MTRSSDEQERREGSRFRVPTRRVQCGETLLIWVLVGLGGVGLWIEAADPLFGVPEAPVFALTLFAFIAGMGTAATLLIWCWPAVWERWFHQVPSEGGNRLEAARMITGLTFGILTVAAVVGMIAFQWHPITIGAIGGALLCSRLIVELWLHHKFGTRPTSLPWRLHAEAGRKLDAIQACRRETSVSLAQAKAAVEDYLMSRSRRRDETDDRGN
jgi:hypothetical protein